MSFALFLHIPSSTPVRGVSASSFNFKPRKASDKFLHNKTESKTPIKKFQTLTARDTVINFGKHKGKMLGTLPSAYLKWVSKNLRAGDSEHWAKLADEVLEDPVYQDRVEWEFAEKILEGSNGTMRNVISSKTDQSNSVSMLLELSERFGWDNEDKSGWSKINFELLGTSKSGRIPKITSVENNNDARNETKQKIEKQEEGFSVGEKRKERREKMKLRREGEMKEKTEIKGKWKGVLDNSGDVYRKNQMNDEKEEEVEIYNPFPGRQSLLKKAFDRRRVL